MTRHPSQSATGVLLLILLLSAAATVVALWVWGMDQRRRRLEIGARQAKEPTAVVAFPSGGSGPDAPIAAEAGVFRSGSGAPAADTGRPRRADAHPRTLATYRALRAWPGAPPRIPHGLTPSELAAQRCNACHERGGYSPRFASYAPVTPHPELPQCTQCHLGDDAVMGIPFPGNDPDGVCRQCHAPATPRVARGRTAATLPWPALGMRDGDGAPPAIPHEVVPRANCVACHAGPGAVAEIRTTHPGRLDCRRCHLGADPNLAPAEAPASPRAIAVRAVP